MKRSRFAFIAALLAGISCSAQLAYAVDCHGAGNPSVWGSNMSAAFPIQAGTSCTYGFRIEGQVTSSRILKPAQHGRVKLINKSTFEYTAPKGYRGPDNFQIQATGHGPSSSGTSVVSVSADVQ
jgi:hypothetical protein